jgi:hypothetical protein
MTLRRTAIGLALGLAATAGSISAAGSALAGTTGWETIDSYSTHALCDQGAIDHGVQANYRCVQFEGLWDLNVPA